MDNSTIESSAVGSVHNKLNDTGFIIVSDIKEGDKNPIWDGNIFVYSSDKQKNNETLRYKIPVQIKGTEANIEKSLKYNIRVNDLKNYRKDGGVLYFIVQVEKGHSENNKIFYVDLLPANINRLLKNKETKGKISIDVKYLPIETKELVNLVLNFGLHKELQASFIPTDKYTLADFKEVCLPFETPFNATRSDILLNFDGYVYGYRDEIPYPFEIPKGTISEIVSASSKISINGTDYFDSCEIIRNIKSYVLIINHNIEFSYNNKGYLEKCSLLLNGSINDYINSMKFLLEVHKYKHFDFDNHKQNCPFEKDDTEVLKNNLMYFENLKEAFDKSGVYEDVELRIFSEIDNKNANILINAFVYNQDIALKTDSKAYVLNIHILDKTITCLALRNENEKYNFLKFPHEKALAVERNGKIFNVPSCLILKKEHLRNSINIKIDTFLDDIKQYPISPTYLEVVNESVLELISAFDDSHKTILLETAENIIKWMEEVNNDEKSAIIYHLNMLQCRIRRRGYLLPEDKNYLYNLSEQSSEISLKYAASVLLKEKDRANICFKQLSKEEQERIINYPIHNLYNTL